MQPQPPVCVASLLITPVLAHKVVHLARAFSHQEPLHSLPESSFISFTLTTERGFLIRFTPITETSTSTNTPILLVKVSSALICILNVSFSLMSWLLMPLPVFSTLILANPSVLFVCSIATPDFDRDCLDYMIQFSRLVCLVLDLCLFLFSLATLIIFGFPHPSPVHLSLHPVVCAALS